MIGLVINILKFIVARILKVYQPEWLLRFDKWCEKKLGLDIVKQEKTFYQKYPGISNRIKQLEKNSHPCKELHEFDVYPELIARIEKLEKNKK
jgi:hypothetical protein